jgi:hypothetical protein
MNEGDKTKFQQHLTGVMSFYRQDVSPFALSVWWLACKAFDFEQVSMALTAHAMDADRGQFAPKPADIVRQLGGTSTDKAMIAWGKAYEAISTVGAYTDVVFDDPAIHAAIEDLGGWMNFCRGQTSELSYLQHRFTESYRAYASRPSFGFPRLLSGDRSSNEAFARRGLKPPKPAVIGDIEKAREVYRLGGAAKAQTSLAALHVSERISLPSKPEGIAA